MKLIVLSCLINVVLSDYEFTEKMASMCKKHETNNGYTYDKYFKVTGGHKSPGIKFELHMAIKAKNNGHILLSPTTYPGMQNPVYEITVGAGGNTFTELRRMRMKMGKSTATTHGILNADKFVPFWVKVHEDGLVEFGKEGETDPLVSFADKTPLEINYFSFTSWSGIKASFLYDCPINETNTDESEVAEKQLTDLERLRGDLLKNYDYNIIPTTMLKLYYTMNSISFDVTKSVLTTHGKLKAHWYDNRMNWDPETYGNISHYNFNVKEIWKPEIKIYDSLDLSSVKWTNVPLRISNNGAITGTAELITRTWCSPSKNLINWPHDKHTCTLRLGLWSQYAQLNVTTLENAGKHFPGQQSFYSFEWELLKIDMSSEWSSYSPYVQFDEEVYNEDNLTEKPRNTFKIAMTIRRIDDTYKATLYAPFACTVLIILITLWISTTPTVKITILCVEQLLVMGLIVEVVNKIPTNTEHIPHIVMFYFWALLSIWLSITVNALTFKMQIEPQPWMNRMHKYLSSFYFNNCLGNSNIKVDETCDQIGHSQDSDKCEDDPEIYFKSTGTMLDRIIFIVFTIIFSIYCFCH